MAEKSKRKNPFPKAGSICPNCKEKWEEAGKPVQILIPLRNRTLRHKHEIAICPHCDGDLMPALVESSAE